MWTHAIYNIRPATRVGGTLTDTFSEIELTTLQSLTNYEAEINNLTKPYDRKALSLSALTQMTASPDTITAIKAVKSDNSSVNLVKADGTWGLPIGTYVRFILTGIDDYFSLLEGSGSILNSAGGNYTLTLGSAPAWVNVTLSSTWQPKIDAAKNMIINRLKTSLSGRVAASDIADAIDSITNPEVLSVASDYKTLELIFIDLTGKIGDREAIRDKVRYFANEYEKAFTQAFYALDFGNYGNIFVNEMGKLSR